MTNKKKMALAGVLVLVMVVSAIGGTLAWLTDTASLDNAFLVGAFTPPAEPKPDPDPPKPDPTQPDPPTPRDDETGKPTTYIFEPYWNANGTNTYSAADKHRLLAGDTTVKDPYIGIGKDSESGYVLACVTNPMKPHVYFTLCEGWEPVDGYVTEVTIDANNSKPTAATGMFYTEGLFKWVGTNNNGDLKALTPADTDHDGKGDGDAWTDHPVFTYVYTAKNGLTEVQKLTKEQQKMTVSAFTHQTRGKANDAATEDTDATTAQVVEAAKSWATDTCGYVKP